MTENCIGIVGTSLPTMRPIYNLAVRGHHCSSHERSCRRCENSGTSWQCLRLRGDPKWPALSFADEGTRNASTSASDIESANRIDKAFEMVLHAKGPAPSPENAVRITAVEDVIS